MGHPTSDGATDSWVMAPGSVAAVLIAVGFRGEALVTALAVAKAESGFDAHATNYASADAKWGPAVGLFQVRVLKDPKASGNAADRARELGSMKDPVTNAAFAYALSRGGSSSKFWRDSWTSYSSGAYKKFLVQAREWALNPDKSAPKAGAASVPLVDNDWIDEDRKPLPIVLDGGATPGDLGNHVVSATVDYSMAEATMATFELEDEHANLLAKANLTEGVALRVSGQRLIVTSVGAKQGPGSPHMTVEAQPAGVVRLRGVVPAKVSGISAVQYARRLAKTVGMPFEGGPASPAIAIAPAEVSVAGSKTAQDLDPTTGLAHGVRKENAWEVLRRLAQESTGYVCFESGGTLFFATQQWLYKHAGVVYVQVGDATFTDVRSGRAIRSVGFPTLRRAIRLDSHNRAYRHAEADIDLPPGPGYDALPGKRLWLAEPSGLVDDARPMLITRTTIVQGDATALVRVQASSYSAPGDSTDTSAPGASVHDKSGYGSMTTTGQTVGANRTGLQAVDWAKRQAAARTTGWYRECDNFVAQCYGLAHSGSETAALHWTRIPAGQKHPDDRNPPIGALLFYATPHNSSGHVALFCGANLLASTDFPIRDRIGVRPVGDLERNWSATYRGWAQPWFG